jgi:imidazolonepropionase-like amidohydrolase
MHSAGVRFATGTDTWDSIARELELMVSEMKVSPMESIVAATRDSAIGLGLESEIGTIEVGKTADLLQVEADPLENISNIRRVARVWRAGKLSVENGQAMG